jgi:hypothetical protein
MIHAPYQILSRLIPSISSRIKKLGMVSLEEECYVRYVAALHAIARRDQLRDEDSPLARSK